MPQAIEPLEVGVMFWTGGVLGVDAPARQIVGTVKDFGVSCGQLGVHGTAEVTPAFEQEWKDALELYGIRVVTVFLQFDGESYASIPECARTVGYVPKETRDARERRTLAVSDFAAKLGVSSLGAHIGALPEDPDDPSHIAVRELLRRVCDHCAENGQTFALETGQESADELRKFILEVDRPNLKVNFDPANMILYGSGKPLEALETVKDFVVSVHCKDGKRPEKPGEWGTETPLGEGDVDMAAYVRKLKQIGYKGTLTIEREILGEEQRADIKRAIALLEKLRADA